MNHSHLVELFLESAWHLHGPVYSRLSGLLHNHINGTKAPSESFDNKLLKVNPADENIDTDTQRAPAKAPRAAAADLPAAIDDSDELSDYMDTW